MKVREKTTRRFIRKSITQRHKGHKEHKEKREEMMNENQIGLIIVDTAVNLHKELGSGLFETVKHETWFHFKFRSGNNERWHIQNN